MNGERLGRIRLPKPRETEEERKFVKAAKRLGWKTRKLNGGGNRNWPDQLVVAPKFMGLIEFKRENEAPRPAQAQLHKELKALGVHVATFYTSNEAVMWINMTAGKAGDLI